MDARVSRICEYTAQCPACETCHSFHDEPPLTDTLVRCDGCGERFHVRGIMLQRVDDQAIAAAARELLELCKVRLIKSADIAAAAARLEALLTMVGA